MDVALDGVRAELLARFEPARGGLPGDVDVDADVDADAVVDVDVDVDLDVTGVEMAVGTGGGLTGCAGGQATRASAYNQCHMHAN